MAKKELTTVILACTKCKRRNYTFRRNKKKKSKINLKKYCRFCRKHVAHKET